MSAGHHLTVVHNPNFDASNHHSKPYEYYSMQFILTKFKISCITHQVVVKIEDDNNQLKMEKNLNS